MNVYSSYLNDFESSVVADSSYFIDSEYFMDTNPSYFHDSDAFMDTYSLYFSDFEASTITVFGEGETSYSNDSEYFGGADSCTLLILSLSGAQTLHTFHIRAFPGFRLFVASRLRVFR